MPIQLVPALPIADFGITSVLAADHAKVRAMVGQILADPSTRTFVYPKINDALHRHDKAESATLYAALASRMPDQIRRSRAEHARLEMALGRLARTNMEIPAWRARFADMVRALEAHLRTEETVVFAAARQLPSDLQRQLGIRYRRLYDRGARMPMVTRPIGVPIVRVQQPSLFVRMFGPSGRNLMLNPGARTLLGRDDNPRKPGNVICQRDAQGKWYCQKASQPVIRLSHATQFASGTGTPSLGLAAKPRLSEADYINLGMGIRGESSRATRRRLGMKTSSQGPAAGEVHTDAFGNQYTTGSGERRL